MRRVDMEFRKLVAAQRAVQGLMNKEMDYQSAYELAQLSQRLGSRLQFFNEESLKLAKTYGKKDETGELMIDSNGRFELDGERSARRYRERLEELSRVEADWPFERTRVRFSGTVTPAQIIDLEPFVEFVKGGET